MRIHIGVNALSNVNAAVYANHSHLYYFLGRLAEKQGYQFTFHTAPRTSIDRMRNDAAKVALQNECDYLWFIDDDMLLSDGTLESLISCEADIAMARTYIRGYPFKNMSFKLTSPAPDIGLINHTDEELEGKDIVECGAVGFACALIKCELLKKIDPPFFITSTHGTEDIYFCVRCQMDLDEPVRIVVDTRVPTGHMLNPEFVGPKTVKHLRKYYEECYNLLPDGEVKRGDRSLNYHQMMEAK